MGKLRGWELELTEKINMGFATSLVLDLEGKVWRVEALFFLFFSSFTFFCCAAVAGGWIWLSRHAESMSAQPQLPALALDNRKASNLHS